MRNASFPRTLNLPDVLKHFRLSAYLASVTQNDTYLTIARLSSGFLRDQQTDSRGLIRAALNLALDWDCPSNGKPREDVDPEPDHFNLHDSGHAIQAWSMLAAVSTNTTWKDLSAGLFSFKKVTDSRLLELQEPGWPQAPPRSGANLTESLMLAAVSYHSSIPQVLPWLRCYLTVSFLPDPGERPDNEGIDAAYKSNGLSFTRLRHH